jgi:hypothetical protein
MAKVMLKNNGNQPVYCNLPGGGSLKIPARSIVEVEEEALISNEIAIHRSRGNITVIKTAAASEAKPESKQGVGNKPSERAKDEKGGEV